MLNATSIKNLEEMLGKMSGNIKIPITFINKETAHAYMAGTFLTGYPIFASTASRNKEDAASMLTALVGRDQQRMQWIPEFLRVFDDVLRYNVCAMEVNWAAKRSTTVQTKVVAGSKVTGAASSVIYEGNQLDRIDPFNLILDTSVEPNKVHSHGTYVGKVELIDYIALKRNYIEWNSLY